MRIKLRCGTMRKSGSLGKTERSGRHAPDIGELPSSKLFQDAVSISERDILKHRIEEISQVLWFPRNCSEKEKHIRIHRAIELLESISPSDGLETMLAVQMVGTHFAALECLRRAMIPDQLLNAQDTYLRNAQKLMALCARQVETLNKHRGKGQQKVTVEHVSIAPGAQAIVGSVSTGTDVAKPKVSDQIEENAQVPSKAEGEKSVIDIRRMPK